MTRSAPAPTLTPRCQIPDWFHDLHQRARHELTDARADAATQQQRDLELQQRIDRLARQLADLEPHCTPHDHAITRSTTDLHHAQQRHRQAEQDVNTTGRLHRRTARQTIADCAADVTTAKTALDEITRRAQPALGQRDQLRTERARLQHHLTVDRQLARSLDRYDHRLLNAQHRLDALDTWADWANGHTPSSAALINAAHHLHHTGGQHTLLANPLNTWIHENDLAPQHPALAQRPTFEHPRRPEPPGLEIGF